MVSFSEISVIPLLLLSQQELLSIILSVERVTAIASSEGLEQPLFILGHVHEDEGLDLVVSALLRRRLLAVVTRPRGHRHVVQIVIIDLFFSSSQKTYRGEVVGEVEGAR